MTHVNRSELYGLGAARMSSGGGGNSYGPGGEVAVEAASPAGGSRWSGRGGKSVVGSAGENAVARADAVIASLLQPFSNVIDQLPNPPDYQNFTRDLKVTPIEAMVKMLDPIKNFALDVSEAAADISGKDVRQVGIPGGPSESVTMRVRVPAGQVLASAVQESASDRADMFRAGLPWPVEATASHPAAQTILRMKVALNWMILGFQDPVVLAKAVVRVLVSYAQRGLITVQQEVAFAQRILQLAVSQFNIPLAGLVNPPQGLFLRAMVSELKTVMPDLQLFKDAQQALQNLQQHANDVITTGQDHANDARDQAGSTVATAQDQGSKLLSHLHGLGEMFGAIPAVDLHRAALAAHNALAVASSAHASAAQSRVHVIAGHVARPNAAAMAAVNAHVKRTAQAVLVAQQSVKKVNDQLIKLSPPAAALTRSAMVSPGMPPGLRRPSDPIRVAVSVPNSVAVAAVNTAQQAVSAARDAVANSAAALNIARAVSPTNDAPTVMPLPSGVPDKVMTLPRVTKVPMPRLIKASLPDSALPMPPVPRSVAPAIRTIQDTIRLTNQQPGMIPPAAIAHGTAMAQQAAAAVTSAAPYLAHRTGLTQLCNMTRDPSDLWFAWMRQHGISIMGLGDPVVAGGVAAATGTGAAEVTSATGEVVVPAAGAAESTAPATTPDMSKLLNQLMDFITKNPKLMGQALTLVGTGGDDLIKLMTDVEHRAPPPGGLPPRTPPAKKEGGFLPFLVGGAVAVVGFPVMGPAALAAGAAAGAAVAALGKKPAVAAPSGGAGFHLPSGGGGGGTPGGGGGTPGGGGVAPSGGGGGGLNRSSIADTGMNL